MTAQFKIDPKRDLVFERVVDVPPELVWAAWTQPEHLVHWFCPRPWKTIECKIDLRPGGRFYTVMQSPEGEKFPNEGCYLEISENRRLIWTSALSAGYRPAKENTSEPFHFSAVVTLAPEGQGTRYTAIVIHNGDVARKQHEEMGFHDGWAKALDQLVEYAKAEMKKKKLRRMSCA